MNERHQIVVFLLLSVVLGASLAAAQMCGTCEINPGNDAATPRETSDP